MASMSNYLENKLIDHSMGTAAYTGPAAVYISLYTTDPTDADTGTEVTGGSYARKIVAWDAASSGSAQTSATATFVTATASWGTITHMGLHDAISGGNLLYHAALAASKIIDNGDIFQVNTGDLAITLN